MTSVHTHYDNLKVSRSAPQEVIRAAYKTLTQKYHPDRNPDNPDAARIMTLINTSYEVLSDADRRRQHDAWIAAEESSAEPQKHKAHQPAKAPDQEFVPPHTGTFANSDLPTSTREKLKQRVSGKYKDQLLIKTGGVVGSYVWAVVLLGWFVYLLFDAGQYKWDQEDTLWRLCVTGAVGVFLAINLSWIVRWHASPFRRWLIVSPLYIIKTDFDRVWYWPIYTLTNINATHNYRNGVYTDTTLNVAFGESKDTFNISPKAMYNTLVDKLGAYDGAFRTAAANGDVDYFTTHDDFIECHSLSVRKPKIRLFGLGLACYIVTFIVAALLFVVATLYNSQMQSKPAPIIKSPERVVPYVQVPKTQPVAVVATKPSYVRPKTAPNGASWPKVAGYVSGFKQLSKGGYSRVTIDNTGNDSDVFVKLVYIGGPEAFPVRVFFIPKGGKFSVPEIKVGSYDIRYRDLDTGGIAKSEPFQVEESRTYNGVQYTDMTMTLYKVRNGNMKTYSIPESEF